MEYISLGVHIVSDDEGGNPLSQRQWSIMQHQMEYTPTCWRAGKAKKLYI